MPLAAPTLWLGLDMKTPHTRAVYSAGEAIARSAAFCERAGGLVAGDASSAVLMHGSADERRIFYSNLDNSRVPADDTVVHGRLLCVLDSFGESVGWRSGGAKWQVRRQGQFAVLLYDRGRYADFEIDSLHWTVFVTELAFDINERSDVYWSKGLKANVENIWTGEKQEELGNVVGDFDSPRFWRGVLTIDYED